MATEKSEARFRRKRSIRKRINGTAERPRLSVFRSAKHMYAQIVDDAAGRTLLACSTRDPELKAALAGKKAEHAARVGQAIAEKCKAQGIENVVFDRNGYIYHGRVSALADAARKAGLKF